MVRLFRSVAVWFGSQSLIVESGRQSPTSVSSRAGRRVERQGRVLVLSLTLFRGCFSDRSGLAPPDSSTALTGVRGPDVLGSIRSPLTSAVGHKQPVIRNLWMAATEREAAGRCSVITIRSVPGSHPRSRPPPTCLKGHSWKSAVVPRSDPPSGARVRAECALRCRHPRLRSRAQTTRR